MAEKFVPGDAKDVHSPVPKPEGLSPLQTEALNIRANPGNSSGLSEHDLRELQLEAWQRTKPPTALTGTHMPFRGENGAYAYVVDPKYGSFVNVTSDGEAEHLSAQAEPVHIKTSSGRSVALEYDTSIKDQQGRPIVTKARVYEADGTEYNLQRVGGTDQWKDSRTGEFREMQVQRALGADPTNTAEVMLKDVKDPSKNEFFAPHNHEPRLTGEKTTAELLASIKHEPTFNNYSWFAEPPFGMNTLKADLKSYASGGLQDFSHLTESKGESWLSKAEEIGSFALKEHGGKIGLGIAAAAGLVVAGKYLFGSHEDTPKKFGSNGQFQNWSDDSGEIRSLHFTPKSLSQFEEPLYKSLDTHRNSKALEKQ